MSMMSTVGSDIMFKSDAVITVIYPGSSQFQKRKGQDLQPERTLPLPNVHSTPTYSTKALGGPAKMDKTHSFWENSKRTVVCI